MLIHLCHLLVTVCTFFSEGFVTKWFIGLTFVQPSGYDIDLTYDIQYFCDIGKFSFSEVFICVSSLVYLYHHSFATVDYIAIINSQ